MNTKLMEYIVKISETSSITKAAQQLFITQSALDQQLIKLEKELGVKLFNRVKNNFSLTEEGNIYVSYAKQIIDLKKEAYTIIDDIAERNAGVLHIGLTPERGIKMFVAVYPDFYHRYPGVTVVPREINVMRQLEMIRQNTLDFGFVAIPKNNVPIPGMNHISIITEDFVLAIPKVHPLASMAAPDSCPFTRIELSFFKDDSFVLMFKESTQRVLIDQLFKDAAFSPNIIFETSSNNTIISMVEAGLGCSILPRYYTRKSEKIVYFSLDGNITLELIACYKHKKYLSKAAHSFIELAAEFWKKKAEVNFR